MIHYNRENISGPKESIVTLYRPNPESSLKEVLKNALGILFCVKKAREIYFVDNVKFHIDTVENLGSFVEIEAIDSTGNFSRDQLLTQCQKFMLMFDIHENDLLDCSYSDLLLKSTEGE